MFTMMAAYDKMPASGSPDKLPVVELRPFKVQEWRPCKSLPDFYDRSGGTISSLSSASGKQSLFSSLSYPDPDKVVMTARSDDVHRERVIQSQRAPRLIDNRPEAPYRDSFVTPPARAKSTVEDIRCGDSANMQFSCFRRALSEGDMIRQQDMRITGHRLNKNDPRPHSLQYTSHWEFYKMPKSYSVPTASAAHPNYRHVNNLCVRINALKEAFVDGGIYDTFDRSSTLPSITVKNAPMRWKKSRQESLTRQASAKVAAPPTYRLGVANSLDVLSHFGRPVRVERQLTMQLKHTINQLRRTKDVAIALGNSTSQFAKQDNINGDSVLRINFEMPVCNTKEEKTFSRGTTNNRSETFGSGIESGASRGGRRANRREQSGEKPGSPLFQRTGTLPYINPPQGRNYQQGERSTTCDSSLVLDDPGASAAENMTNIKEGESAREKIPAPSSSLQEVENYQDVDLENDENSQGPDSKKINAGETESKPTQSDNSSPNNTPDETATTEHSRTDDRRNTPEKAQSVDDDVIEQVEKATEEGTKGITKTSSGVESNDNGECYNGCTPFETDSTNTGGKQTPLESNAPYASDITNHEHAPS